MNNTTFDDKTRDASALLSSITNQNRLKILFLLQDGERSVGELASLIGLAQSPLSQHLAKLRAQNVVATRRSGQSVYYRLDCQTAKNILDLLAQIYKITPPHSGVQKEEAAA